MTALFQVGGLGGNVDCRDAMTRVQSLRVRERLAVHFVPRFPVAEEVKAILVTDIEPVNRLPILPRLPYEIGIQHFERCVVDTDGMLSVYSARGRNPSRWSRLPLI